MARIFVGDPGKVNPQVLEKVKTLPDDFWVLAEFTVTRNVDWLLIRPMGTAPAMVILAETKGIKGRLRGSTNGPWQQEASPGEWTQVETPNAADVNYYFQSVNTVNALIEWLHNNAPVIGEGTSYPWSEIRIWPDLLLMCDAPGISHLLPVGPDNKFGMWFTDPDKWIAHVEAWRPRIGPPISHRDVENLVNYLRLTPVDEGHPLPLPEFPWEEEADIQGTQRRVRALEQRVSHLEGILAEIGRAVTPTRS